MWWENEEPQIVRTEKNVLRWYPGAGKLQVARPDWVNEDGEAKPGKAVTLDCATLRREALGRYSDK